MGRALSEKKWKVPRVNWEGAIENTMSRRLKKVLMNWIPFAEGQFHTWSDKPNCGYFFRGDFWYMSDCSSTTLVYAILSKLGEYDQSITGVPRTELKEKAIKVIRYMGFTHDVGPKDCVRVKGSNPYCSGKKWGGEGDRFFMASQNGRTIGSIAQAAWLLWEDLDNETKVLVQGMITSYADKWSMEEPRNGSYYDTQCEENAWTAAGIAAGVAMFPYHPNHDIWVSGFQKWSINSVTTYYDRLTSRSGLIEPLDDTDIRSITFHPDYTTENHAFVHPSYLCAGINLRAAHINLALMGGQKILDSATFNNKELYDRTVKVWAQFDGLAVPIQGQDWWYNRHHERQLTHAVLNVIHNDPDAARYERNALESIEKLQGSNQRGCLLEEKGENLVLNADHDQSAIDFEHGSAVDLASSYLLHVFGGEGAKPSDQKEMMSRLTGVYDYPHGNAIVHRTKNSFSTFSWRNSVMGLTLPNKGLWNITPLFNSYTGLVEMENTDNAYGVTNEKRVQRVRDHNINKRSNGFGATVSFDRGANKEVSQDVHFVSLPNGTSVYTEQFHVNEPSSVTDVKTGMIGIRNENYIKMPELAKGERTIYLPDKKESFAGFYGYEPDRVTKYPPCTFVNVDDEIGYILGGSRGVTYINKHQYTKWKGIEDILILNDMGKEEFQKRGVLSPFTVISLPNYSYEETKEMVSSTRFLKTNHEGVVMINLNGSLVFSNSNKRELTVLGETPINSKTVQLFKGKNDIVNNRFRWSGRIDEFCSGYIEASCAITFKDLMNVDVNVSVLDTQVIFENKGNDSLSFTLRENNTVREVIITPRDTVTYSFSNA
ncbi:hypothetical protein [Alteribacter aurantiacus]|uniref:hypothetical protein n=1 Tax=Alteribacter aurantiacus TaxID=254410 RepID=UPI0003F9E18F|nr:hypothetical protein [Alteribacter aurantiacus]